MKFLSESLFPTVLRNCPGRQKPTEKQGQRIKKAGPRLSAHAEVWRFNEHLLKASCLQAQRKVGEGHKL